MKTSFGYLLFLITLMSCAQTSNEVRAGKGEVIFKSITKPNKIYTTELESTSETYFDFKGPEEQINRLKSNGVTLPVEFSSTTSMKTIMETGEPVNDTTFKVVLTYDNVSKHNDSNGTISDTKDVLSGTVLKGAYYNGKKIKVDTIINESLDQSLRETLAYTLENIQDKISFPETPMKVGDSFDQVVPLQIPVSGMAPVSLVMTSSYMLKSIEKGIATFDTNIAVEMDMSIEQANVSAKGKGTGISAFNISESLITTNETDLTIDLSVEIDELTMTGNIKAISSQTITIEDVVPTEYFTGYMIMDVSSKAKNEEGEKTLSVIPGSGVFYYRNGSFKQVYGDGGIEYSTYSSGAEYIYFKFTHSDTLIAYPVKKPSEFDMDMEITRLTRTETIRGLVCDQIVLENDLVKKTFIYNDEIKIDGSLFKDYQFDNRNIFSESNSLPLKFILETNDYIMEIDMVRIHEELMSQKEFEAPDLPVKYIDQ